jgi:hypothetical protein
MFLYFLNALLNSSRVRPSKGIVYSEDLPKLDYVSPTLHKQILEGKDINLALLLYSKNEVPQTRTNFGP